MAKISYISAQLRVRCEFTRLEAAASEDPPNGLMDRAISKLEQQQIAGKIATFFLYEERFFKAWKLFGQSWEADDAKMTVTIGVGSPIILGISIQKSFFPKIAAKVTIETPVKILRELRFYFVYHHLKQLLLTQKIKKKVDPAAVQNIFFRACAGENIVDYPINRSLEVERRKGAPPYHFQYDGKSKCINLVLHNPVEITAEVWTKLLLEFREIVKVKNKKNGAHYTIFLNDLKKRLQSAHRGVERLGLELPELLMVAGFMHPRSITIDADHQMLDWDRRIKSGELDGKQIHGHNRNLNGSKDTNFSRDQFQNNDHTISLSSTPDSNSSIINLTEKKQNSLQAAINGETFSELTEASEKQNFLDLKIEISKDAMSAQVIGFNTNIYKNEPIFDQDCLTASFEKQGIKAGLVSNAFSTIKENFGYKKDCNGIVIALGQAAVEGHGAFLMHSYLKTEADQELDKKQVDIRESQQTSYVRKGQLVSRIGFSNPSIDGFTVTGDVIPAPVSEEVARFKAGEGIEKRGITFFAKKDGIPNISGEEVFLTTAFVMDGDVNLTSGNLRYDGNVILNGSVDIGAKVWVDGNLVIEGEVLDAEIVVGGNLELKGGVKGGENSRIYVKGNAKVNFMENVTLYVGKDMTVERTLINAKVYCRGKIESAGSESGIMGGMIKCKGSFSIASLGRDNGDESVVQAGVDWSVENMRERRKNRIRKIKQLLVESEQNLKKTEQTRIKATSKAKRDEMEGQQAQKIKDLALSIKKLRRIAEKASKLEASCRIPKNDPHATISVQNELSTNCKIRIAEKDIPIPGKYAQVLVRHKVVGGTHFSDPSESKPAA